MEQTLVWQGMPKEQENSHSFFVVVGFKYLFIWLRWILVAIGELFPCSSGAWEQSLPFSRSGALAELLCGRWDLGSLTKDQTCIPCIARQILSHWTTTEVPKNSSLEGHDHRTNSLHYQNQSKS